MLFKVRLHYRELRGFQVGGGGLKGAYGFVHRVNGAQGVLIVDEGEINSCLSFRNSLAKLLDSICFFLAHITLCPSTER